MPTHEILLLPVLEVCSERMVSVHEAIAALADQYNLSIKQREQRVPSGTQTTLSNRVNWAKTYLKQAGLIRYPARSYFEITDAGKKVLQAKPVRISFKFLEQFAPFREFRARGAQRNMASGRAEDQEDIKPIISMDDGATPDKTLRDADEAILSTLAAELLGHVRNFAAAVFREAYRRALKVYEVWRRRL